MTTMFGIQPALAENNAADKAEQQRQTRIKEEERQQKKREIYQRMAREGISRESVEALGALGSRTVVNLGRPSTKFTEYPKIAAQEVLKLGEHYRFELDEYILTMVMPDARQSQSWIVPYVDTRTEPERGEAMREAKHGLEVANLAWHYGTGVYPLYFGWDGHMALTISYRYLKPEEKDNFSTPEKFRQRLSAGMKSNVPSQTEIDDAKRKRMILNSAGNRVYLDAETVVIHGRVWVRGALNGSYDRIYTYTTALSSDRMLRVSIQMPGYDYNANPDASTYPAPLKRAFAQMEEMMASLRVAKRNDGGKPDPFVIERVEPAPLPVREKLPNP